MKPFLAWAFTGACVVLALACAGSHAEPTAAGGSHAYAVMTAPAADGTVAPDVPVAFDASTSRSDGSTLASYAWDFGDGSTASGATATHAFANDTASPVSRTVTLTVTDQLGAHDSATRTLTVGPGDLAVAVFTSPSGPLTIAPGTPVDFSATRSFSTHSTLSTYHWDFGDGVQDTGLTTTHTFGNTTAFPIACTVTLQVTDALGATGSATTQVTIQSDDAAYALISAPASAVTVASGTSVDFDGTRSYSTRSTLSSCTWDFGDGTRGSGLRTSHAFTNTGTSPVTRTVTLTVVDGASQSGTATVNVTVTP